MNYLIFILSQGPDATTASLETETKLKNKLTEIENSMNQTFSNLAQPSMFDRIKTGRKRKRANIENEHPSMTKLKSKNVHLNSLYEGNSKKNKKLVGVDQSEQIVHIEENPSQQFSTVGAYPLEKMALFYL